MPATVVDPADTYVVLRPFTARGGTVERGKVVDCREWRNVQPLVNTRYLAPIYTALAREAMESVVKVGDVVEDVVEDVAETAATDGGPVRIEPRRSGRSKSEKENA